MIFGKGRVPFEKKKKKERKRRVWMYGCQDCLGRRLIFSVLNEDVDKKDSGSGQLQR